MKAAEPGRCVICGEPAEYVCDRIVHEQRSVPAHELRRGDQLLSRAVSHLPQLRRRTGLQVQQVENIHDRRLRVNPPLLHRLFVLVDVTWRTRGLRPNRGSFFSRPRRRFQIERARRCGAFVCFRHVREAAENVHYCHVCSQT